MIVYHLEPTHLNHRMNKHPLLLPRRRPPPLPPVTSHVYPY